MIRSTKSYFIFQLVTDNRYYTVRYASCHHSGNPRYKYYNSTDLNYMIDDLKPNTQYEFTVKVVKVDFMFCFALYFSTVLDFKGHFITRASHLVEQWIINFSTSFITAGSKRESVEYASNQHYARRCSLITSS